MDKSNVYVQANNVGKPVLLNSSEVELLLSCSSFRLLTTHAEHFYKLQKVVQIKNRKGLVGRFSRYLWAYSSREGLELPIREKELLPLRQKLQEWAEAGLLISETDLKNDMITLSRQSKRQKEKAAASRISVVGIPTCGRGKTYCRRLQKIQWIFQD